MYAWHEFRHLTGTRTEAELLVELKTCLSICLRGTPDSLQGVRGLFLRIGGLPNKAALRFCCEGCSVLLRMEGALCVSIGCYNPAGSGHLELEISIVWYCVESSKRSSSEQCVIAAAEGDDIED